MVRALAWHCCRPRRVERHGELRAPISEQAEPARPTTFRRLRLVWVLGAVAAAWVIFIGGAWAGISTAVIRVLTMLIAAGTLVAWLLAWRRNSETWRPRTSMWPAIASVLASLAISTLFSRFPRVSLEYLSYTIVLIALYLLGVRLLAQRFFGPRLLTLFGMFFWIICVAFLALVVGHWVEWWGLIGRFAVPPLRPNFEGLTYLNPSAVLTMVALLAVPALAVLEPTTVRRRVAIVLTLLVVAVVAFLTGSRAGWLALALTAAFLLVVVAVRRDSRTAVRASVAGAGRRGAVVMAVAAVALIVAAVVFLPAVVRRLSEGGEDQRLEYAVTAIRMFESSPVVGTGPGSWVIQRLAYTRLGEPDFYIPHAHNLEVQTLAEQGIVGLAAGVVVAAAVLSLVLRAMRSSDQRRRWVGWLTLGATFYFCAHQLLDFYENMPAVLLAAALPIAYLDATTPTASTGSRWRLPRVSGRITGALGTVAVAVAIVLLTAQEIPAAMSDEAARRANLGDWEAAGALASQAQQLDPSITPYALTAGLAASRRGDHVAATQLFWRVATTDDLPEAWLNLAAEQAAQGDNEAAKASLLAAARLGRQRPSLAIGIADVALRVGQEPLARAAIEWTLAAYPMLAAEPWWETDPRRAAARDDVVSGLAASASPALRWELALGTGDLAAARALAPQLPDATFYADVVEAWRGDARAVARVQAACSAEALQDWRLRWCGRLARRLGDAALVKDMQRLLETLGPGFSHGAGEVRIVLGDSGPHRLEGAVASFWGTFTYRRPTPQDIVVPGVAHLVLD